jgi:hypothetical protein
MWFQGGTDSAGVYTPEKKIVDYTGNNREKAGPRVTDPSERGKL